MININFEHIRVLDKSQNEAFEEFVCQLARKEDNKDKIDFYRLGKPDGGVECYCVLRDNSEIGWQAKYFTSALNENRFKQIDKSVKTVLQTHPKLKRYIIAIPINPSDAGKNRNTVLKKWKERVNKWKDWAKAKTMNVEFNAWWESDLIQRLQKPENSGMINFWFNKDEFTDEWFNGKLNVAIRELGKRYTPELNFELDIAKVFDGLARDEHFKKQLEEVYDKMLMGVDEMMRYASNDVIKKQLDLILEEKKHLQRIYDTMKLESMNQVPFEHINKICTNIDSSVIEIYKKLFDKQKELEEQKKDAKDDELRNLVDMINRFRNDEAYIERFTDPFNAFKDFINSETCRLVNLPIMILNGEWGKGKSHLVADVAGKRMTENKPSILLLGQQFLTKDDPWTQIFKKLQLQTSTEEFLGALDAKAQTVGSRIVIFIDAINEGEGRLIWKNYIKGFLEAFKKFECLGLVLTIRESYVKLIVPQDEIDDNEVVRITHYGFQGLEYEAVKFFFNNYGIELPSTPILQPEFSTPLFLKIFCEGLKKSGFKRIPDGMDGITSIMDLYVTSVNKNLSERLNYPWQINLVYQAANIITQKKLETTNKFLKYQEAFELLEPLLRKYSNNSRFLDELINEGFLALNLLWIERNRYEEIVYFVYERLENHLAASYIIDEFVDKKKPKDSFSKGTKLYEYVKNESEIFFNFNLIEALSIQLPERIKFEFHEIAEHTKGFHSVIQAFVKSLIWRKTDTITDKLIDYINNYVIKFEPDLFWDTLLTIATKPKHYFNADFLHEHLFKIKLPDRDAWWTQFIHYRYPYEETSIKRLIDWGWNENDKSNFSDESIRLAAKTIAWFLTSTNRNLRDGSTKALVCLLENRINVLISVLKDFKGVNDPYVYERLLCVSYGVAVRTTQIEKLKELSEYIYQTIFNQRFVYPHILLRDYARQVIEFANYCNIKLNFDINKIRPPYHSIFPKKLPSNKFTDKYHFDYNAENFKNYYWSQNSILMSMATERGRKDMMYGDFGRYVFQSGFRSWKNLDAQELSNLAIKKIFKELGYDVEKHGQFDRSMKQNVVSRHYVAEERIGKKYQWITFYELLARVSDNFQKFDEWSFSEENIEKYDGPWTPYVRDIDPTMVIRKTGEEDYDEIKPNYWWYNVDYSDWKCDEKKWIKKRTLLPNPEKLINVKEDSETEWLVLETYPEWSEPKKMGVDKWKSRFKRLWYQVRSYLIEEKDFDKFIEWGSKQNFMGRWMPEISSRYEIFSREYYWSPPYKYFFNSDLHKKYADERIPCKVKVTTNYFLWEEGYDLSKEETIRFLKPCSTLYEKMNMKYSKKEGEFLNAQNELICYDPSVNNNSLSCLLIRKDALREFLKINKLRIVWTVIGEKQIMIDDFSNREYLGRLIISGLYYADMNCKIRGNMKTFLE